MDANPKSNATLRKTTVALDELQDILMGSPEGCKRVIFLLDACRNLPNVVQAGRDNQTPNHDAGKLLARTGVLAQQVVNKQGSKEYAILSACKSNQRAYADPAHRQGAFTYWFLQALENAPSLTLQDIAGYVKPQVKAWSKARPQLTAKPTDPNFDNDLQEPILKAEDSGKTFLVDPGVSTLILRTATLTITSDLSDIVISEASAGVVSGSKLTVTFKPGQDFIVVQGKVRARTTEYEPEPFALVLQPGEAKVYAVTMRPRGTPVARTERAADRARQPRPNRPDGFPALADYLESMCLIPGAPQDKPFKMGPSYDAHWVALSIYFLGATPVTVALWKEYVAAIYYPATLVDRITEAGWEAAMPKKPKWGWIDSHPIVNVSWNDIMGVGGRGKRSDDKPCFCAWVKTVSGLEITLPTEAQWEFAARGGLENKTYPWGDEFDRSKLWCSEKAYADAKRTAPVNRSSRIFKNAYGLTDMAGNVEQWCFDFYDRKYYESFLPLATLKDAIKADSVPLDPWNKKPVPYDSPSSHEPWRSIRGKSWMSQTVNDSVFSCAHRDAWPPDTVREICGFRCAAKI